MKKIILFIFILSICIASVSAISISIPQNRHFTFEPFANFTVYFQVVNNDGYAQDVSFYAKGDLTEYVSFHPGPEVFLEAGEKHIFSATYSLPESIPPGLLEEKIGAAGKGTGQAAMIGATTAVQVRIFIRGRHQGKMIVPKMQVKPNEAGKPIDFTLEYTNVGTETINEVASRVTVTDLKGKSKGFISLDPVELPYDEKKQVKATFQTNGMQKGRYYANATIMIDGEELQREVAQEFRLGSRDLNIAGHTQRLQAKDLALFQVNLSSDWNQDMRNVYMEAEISKGNGLGLATFKSPTIDLKPFQTLAVEGYFDLANATLGTNTVRAKLKSLDGVDKEVSLPVNIVEPAKTESPKVFTNNTMFVLVVLIILLIFMNLAWFIYLNHTKHNKQPPSYP